MGARGGQIKKWSEALCVAFLLFAPAFRARAQASDPAALAVVRQAVAAEQNASRTDKTPWSYRDHDVQPGRDAVSRVIESPEGDLHRLLVLNGTPLTGNDAAREADRLRTFVASPEQQARERKAAAADGKQASAFLAMLPDAFLWSVTRQNAQATELKFRPNPDFRPPDTQARVLGVLAGEMVVSRGANRIQSLRGTLTDDVKFGFGVFGKIDRGGTFDVERRELSPGKWQITETHVHIGGHAMLFKTIGQQEDEVKTDWHLSTAPTLQVALEMILR